MTTENQILADKMTDNFLEDIFERAIFIWTGKRDRTSRGDPYKRVQRVFTGLVMEEKFKHFLNENKINYTLIPREDEPTREDIKIGDNLLNLKGYILDTSKKYLIEKGIDNLTLEDKSWLLDCVGLVPLDQLNPNSGIENDLKRIFVFNFLKTQLGGNLGSNKRGLLHIFYNRKINQYISQRSPKILNQVGKLKFELKPNLDTEMNLKIYGMNLEGKKITEIITLQKSIIQVESHYHYSNVLALRLIDDQLPTPLSWLFMKTDSGEIDKIQSKIGFELKRPRGKPFELIENNWVDIYIYNPIIFLTGFIDDEDYRIEGREYRRYSKDVKQYSDTYIDNFGCLVSHLRPIKDITKLK